MPDHPAIARADIVIIGAGIMGASIAFQLSRQNDKQIIVVDARQPVGACRGVLSVRSDNVIRMS